MGPESNKDYDDYEKTSNDHSAWNKTSKTLLASSCILKKEYDRALKQMRKQTSDIVPLGFELLAVIIILRGMAIECWFKSIYLKRGGKIVKNNKFFQPKNLEIII